MCLKKLGAKSSSKDVQLECKCMYIKTIYANLEPIVLSSILIVKRIK